MRASADAPVAASKSALDVRASPAGHEAKTWVEGPVHPSEVIELWPVLARIIAQGIAEGANYWTTDDVLLQLLQGQLQLFMACGPEPFMVAVVRLIQRPRLKVCFIEVLAGEKLGLAKAGIANIETWARRQGCSVIQAAGRRGWERVSGWNSSVMIWKELENA